MTNMRIDDINSIKKRISVFFFRFQKGMNGIKKVFSTLNDSSDSSSNWDHHLNH